MIKVTDQLYIGPSPICNKDLELTNIDALVCIAGEHSYNPDLIENSYCYDLASPNNPDVKGIFFSICQTVSELLNDDKTVYLHSLEGTTRCAVVAAFVISSTHGQISHWLETLEIKSDGKIHDRDGWYEFVLGLIEPPTKELAEIPKNIELYTAMPYGDETWFHVGYNEHREGIDAVWNLEDMFIPEKDSLEHPLKAYIQYFDNIRLHYALDYTSWKYHEPLMRWCLGALTPGGNLQIISRDANYIFKYWLRDLLGDVKSGKGILKFLSKYDLTKENFPALTREEMAKSISIPTNQPASDWEFDLWLNQKLFSSGSGLPQDSFKSLLSLRYLSSLLKRSGFIINNIEVSSDNPEQIVAYAYKHASRIL